jgi:hypothetical protein
MGLISGVLLLPLAPVRGVVWLANQVTEAAEREMHDPDVIRARLRALNEALEGGAIDEETFEREEERLLDALDNRTPRPARPAATVHDRTKGMQA